MKSKVKQAPKTVRFDALVESSGRPEPVTLWTKPEDDRDFMRAVREKRVATLVQTNVGTKKDFGVVGFQQEENASYLVFPKAISYPAESKIVGIKYERLTPASAKGLLYKPKPAAKPGIPMREKRRFLLDDEAPQAAKHEAEVRATSREATREKAKKPERVKTRKFAATVVLTAVQKVKIAVEAESSAAAEKTLRSAAAKVEMDLTEAKITRTIKKG